MGIIIQYIYIKVLHTYMYTCIYNINVERTSQSIIVILLYMLWLFVNKNKLFKKSFIHLMLLRVAGLELWDQCGQCLAGYVSTCSSPLGL